MRVLATCLAGCRAAASPARMYVEVAVLVLVSAAGVGGMVDVVMLACVRIMNTVLPTHARAKSLWGSGRPLHLDDRESLPVVKELAFRPAGAGECYGRWTAFHSHGG